MENNHNRVINDLQAWQLMERNWKTLLGPQIVQQRYYIRERLKSLKEIPAKYKGQPLNKDEKSALAIVKGEISRYEKFMYPHPLIRAMYKLNEFVNLLADLLVKKKVPDNRWKPSIGAITERKMNSPDKGSSHQEVSAKKSTAKQQRQDNAPSRNRVKNARTADDSLIPKLRTSNGKGIKR